MSETNDAMDAGAPSAGDMPPNEVGTGGGEYHPVDPMIRTLLLVSGIANAVFALFNLAGTFIVCYTFIFAIPLIVLAVFEFMLWNQLGQPGDHRDKASKLQIIAICEIVTILGCNVASLVCGVMQLVNKNKLDAPTAGSTDPA